MQLLDTHGKIYTVINKMHIEGSRSRRSELESQIHFFTAFCPLNKIMYGHINMLSKDFRSWLHPDKQQAPASTWSGHPENLTSKI